jgi:hypothetical protein
MLPTLETVKALDVATANDRMMMKMKVDEIMMFRLVETIDVICVGSAVTL